MCFELGRFPFELPEDLPDEQVTLMFAYLQVLAEDRRDAQTRSAGTSAQVAAARRVEAEHQAAEADAWATSRPARR